VYIHKPYAKTANARYKVHGVRGQNSEVLVSVNQAKNVNNWYRLGVFTFDANVPNSGRVFLNDVTGTDDETLTFDAVRWRRVVTVRPTPTTNVVSSTGTITRDGVLYADGFDCPVGNRTNSGIEPVLWCGPLVGKMHPPIRNRIYGVALWGVTPPFTRGRLELGARP
jgi:hypothetical protein